MSDERSPVVEYITKLFATEDFVLNNVLVAQEAGGGPMMNIGPDQGKLLYLLVKLIRAQNVLEVGSYYGYSTIWLGRAVQELNRGRKRLCKEVLHKLDCIELDPAQADIVRGHLRDATLEECSEVHTGSGVELMERFTQAGRSFDLIFVDADKANYSRYLDLAAQLLPSGGLLLVDNVIWSGKVLEPDVNCDKNTLAIKTFNEKLAKSQDFESVIATVQDGLALAVKR